MDFALRLKKVREDKGLSQNRLAKITNIGQDQISRFESGKKVYSNDLIKICKALEVSADYLLGLIDDDLNEKG